MTLIERLDRREAAAERDVLTARLRSMAGTDDRRALRARTVDGSLTEIEAAHAARLETLDYLLDDDA
jgi:hypothetical protein